MNQNEILTQLHLYRAGLACTLVSRAEFIAWADKIIMEADEPDDIFIRISMSGSSKINDLIHDLNVFLNFEKPVVIARPLLAMIYQKHRSKELTSADVLSKLRILAGEALLTEEEEKSIYFLDIYYDLVHYDSEYYLEELDVKVSTFLQTFQGYSFHNIHQWPELDASVAQQQIEEEKKQYEASLETIQPPKKPWWKIW